MHDPRHSPPVTTLRHPATTGRYAARALYVVAVVLVAVAFSPLGAVLVTALCGLTVAAARSGGAS